MVEGGEQPLPAVGQQLVHVEPELGPAVAVGLQGQDPVGEGVRAGVAIALQHGGQVQAVLAGEVGDLAGGPGVLVHDEAVGPAAAGDDVAAAAQVEDVVARAADQSVVGAVVGDEGVAGVVAGDGLAGGAGEGDGGDAGGGGVARLAGGDRGPARSRFGEDAV